MIYLYKVTGVVQGVCFRASTQDQAVKLGLQGWVRNCADGSVETLASGNATQLQVFEQWLHQGPAYAKVSAVTIREITTAEPDYATLSNLSSGFHITY